MIKKIKEKETAIKLRKEGRSYSEILTEVFVAKSTLSLWLRDVGLSKRQKQRLTKKRIKASLKGAKTKREQRIALTKEIKDRSKNKVGKLTKRELWLVGTALYWAEGTKQKEHNPSQGVQFSNSDPRIIKVFLKWIKEVCKTSKKDICFRIFLHENNKKRLKEVQKYWSKTTQSSIKNFHKITWKKNKVTTIRKNMGNNYFGLLNIKVKKSTNLNREIEGWIEGIFKNCGVVQR